MVYCPSSCSLPEYSLIVAFVDPIGVAFEAFTPETLKGVAEALRAQGIDEVISQSASLIDSLKAKAHRLYTSSPSSSSSSSTST